MSDRVDSRDWTDDEWIRVLREFSPATDFALAEAAVARWRAEQKEARHE